MPLELPPATDDVNTEPANQHIRETLARIDLTCVYNYHQLPEDAEETLSHIEPDSIVFIEGVCSTDRPKEQISKSHTGALITLGKDSPIYQNLKRMNLDSLDTTLEDLQDYQTSRIDFMRHAGTLLRGLIAKDCIIQYADYDWETIQATCGTQQHGQERMNTFTDALQLYKTGLEDTLKDPRRSKAQKLNDLKGFVRGKQRMLGVRDCVAPLMSACALDAMYQYPTIEERAKTPDGKLRTYTTYGLGHRYSLTDQYKGYGVAPHIIEPHSLHPLDYITPQKDMAHFWKILPVRIAQTAVWGLYAQYAKDRKEITQLEYDSYDALAEIIDSKQAMVDFVARCIDAWERVGTKSPSAHAEVLSIARSYMPKPDRFLGSPIAVGNSQTDEPLAA